MALRRRIRVWLGCFVSLATTGNLAAALPFAPRISPGQSLRATPLDDVSEPTNRSFAGQFGLANALESLRDGGAPRRRQLRVFASNAEASHGLQAQVARVLHLWLEEQPTLSAEERLAVVRALAPLNRQAVARKHLLDFLALPSTSVDRVETRAQSLPPNARNAHLRELAARTAALALARSQHPDALHELGHWLRRPNVESEYAAQALLLAPPADPSPILRAPGPVTPLLLRTLGRLRNPASEPFLRRVLKRATAPVQAEAALALLALNVAGTDELALHWLAQSPLAPELLKASTLILFHHRHEARGQALRRLLDASPTLAFDVLEEHSDAELLVLSKHLHALEPNQREAALAHFARLGRGAVPFLVETLSASPELALSAAALLGRLADPAAERALVKLAQVPTDPRKLETNNTQSRPRLQAQLAHWALAVQALRGHAEVDTTRMFLASRLRQAPATERDATQLALAALDVDFARQLLASDEPRELGVAARVVGAHDATYRAAAAHRLSQFYDRPLDPRALALAPVVSALGTNDALPLTLLHAWAQSSLPVAYSAVWQLCTRLSVHTTAPLERWLESSDPELRAAVYWGLGSNPAPEQTARLLSALETEVDPWVHQSVVAALLRRPRITPVLAALEREKTYNPDPEVQRLLRGAAKSQGNDLWWSAPEGETRRFDWLTLTSTGYAPVVIPLHDHAPVMLLLPDTRAFFADTFHIRTHEAPPTPQASN